MYVTSFRNRDKYSFQKTLSWRTGRAAAGQHRIPPPPVLKPSASLAEKVAARQSYLAMVNANVSHGERFSGYSLTGDSGHSFHTSTIKSTSDSCVTYLENVWTGARTQVRYGRAIQAPRVTGSEASFLNTPGAPSYGPGWTLWAGPPQPNNQSWISSAYAGAALDRPLTGWAETAVEIASGNIPRLLSSLIRRIKTGRVLDPKGIGKDLGSEYLNAQFGIMPIIRDAIATIDNLAVLADGLYGEYSRKRTSPLEVVAYSEPQSYFSVHYGDGSVGSSTTRSTDMRMLEDTRLTMKVARARPSLASNDFLAKAFDLSTSLGFNKPSLGWDVIPWSWMVDWAANIGESLDNAAYYSRTSGTNKTAYAYATRKRIITTEAYPVFSRRSGNYYYKYNGTGKVTGVCVDLIRDQSSPFGFAFKLPNLSGSQWAILAALGLAKRP